MGHEESWREALGWKAKRTRSRSQPAEARLDPAAKVGGNPSVEGIADADTEAARGLAPDAPKLARGGVPGSPMAMPVGVPRGDVWNRRSSASRQTLRSDPELLDADARAQTDVFPPPRQPVVMSREEDVAPTQPASEPHPDDPADLASQCDLTASVAGASAGGGSEVDDPHASDRAATSGEPSDREDEVLALDSGDDRGDPKEGDFDDDEFSRDRRWQTDAVTGSLLAVNHIEDADPVVPFRIQGWLAARGPSVWFGAGSTGKTQLMLWMAAMIASRPEDRNREDWLGGRVNGTGHVLILTAEDSREQILGRIRDIVTRTMKQDEDALMRTCSRLHVMAYLSFTEQEFGHDNPSLFQLNAKDRVWERTPVMKEIRRYIAVWNRHHRDPEDKIVGVVMDSATSMAGFDSLDAQATTNFFFYLGRLCERRRIFWSIIGHTPKAVSVPKANPQGNATARLRGVAMWTTAPRMTVEVRHIQEWGRKKSDLEEPELRARLPGFSKQDILVVAVAKANLLGAHRGVRHLVRMRRGSFADVTENSDDVYEPAAEAIHKQFNENDDATNRDGPSEVRTRSSSSKEGPPRPITPQARPRRARDQVYYSAGTALVRAALPLFLPNMKAGEALSANGLFKFMRATYDEADQPAMLLVHEQSGGVKNGARKGAINWHLNLLVQEGLLTSTTRSRRTTYFLSDAGRSSLYPKGDRRT